MSRPVVAALAWCSLTLPIPAGAQEADPAEVTIGERLFLETRFAEFFARNAPDVNAPLPAGDPAVETTETTQGSLPGPFAGASINCRACHLVDEQLGVSSGGMRSYSDFARRSPVSAREDGRESTSRNSPPLVNASLRRRGGLLLHFDGEFETLADLVRATLTGRNYGWLPDESQQALAHVARVIREDDGSGELAQEFGGAYARVLSGRDPALPEELRLRPSFLLDVQSATDDRVVDVVARLIAAYVEQLVFETDEHGAFTGSPFDQFLELNRLPRTPRGSESAAKYTKRLRKLLGKLRDPISVAEGRFAFHDQQRVFGPQELAGLRIFLARAPGPRALTPEDLSRGGVGNCTACHPAPTFSDFRFHNTGVSQLGYDAIHGAGRFLALEVPDLQARSLDPRRWLPATAQHPDALEPLRAAPDAAHPERADLGVWNVFANADFPKPQTRLRRALCVKLRRGCKADLLLDRALAAFKTPGLRDLSHSAPYMHDGSFDTLADVLELYREVSDLARAGELRNADPALAGIALTPGDAQSVAAFLRSLNEDYE